MRVCLCSYPVTLGRWLQSLLLVDLRILDTEAGLDLPDTLQLLARIKGINPFICDAPLRTADRAPSACRWPVLCHASHCLPHICGQTAACCFSFGPLHQCGDPRPHARGPLEACGVNTCRSDGLPLLPPPNPLAYITSLLTSPLVSRSRPNSRNCSMWSSFFPLQISMASASAFTWNSSGPRTSRKIKLEMPSQTPVLTLLMEI